MISRLRLINFKGFEDFTVHFRDNSLLVGPNNAGKSTVIGALRFCAAVLVNAKRRKPDVAQYDHRRGRSVRAISLSGSLNSLVGENVKHEMRDQIETRVELQFKNKATLYCIWPQDDGISYAYLEHIEGAQPLNTRVVREWYSGIGVIQTLSPVEHHEQLLSETYIQNNMGSRLTSRHFRNQLFYVQRSGNSEYDRLESFLVSYTPEITSLSLFSSVGEGDPEINLMFQEATSRTEKEICWAGDGLQVWLQLLFHIWRQAEISTLILDEPDVFLHPDLQRRLVHILEDLRCQVVLATHAPELLAEASRETVVMIDRHKKRSSRINDDAVLSDLNSVLGSGFNLRLARALRSRVALFVEGQDMRIIKHFARTIGAQFVAQERGLTVVPMGGASNRNLASSFGWLNSNFLDGAVTIYVLLDRDYMPADVAERIEREFKDFDVNAHVWERKELESYLLCPSAISRLSGMTYDEVNELLDAALHDLKDVVRSRYLAERIPAGRPANDHIVTVYDKIIPEFENRWDADTSWRLYASPAKMVLSSLNRMLQEQGRRAATPAALSRSMRADEIPVEMRDFLLRLNANLA